MKINGDMASGKPRPWVSSGPTYGNFHGSLTMIKYKTLGTYGNCHMILTMINQTLLGI